MCTKILKCHFCAAGEKNRGKEINQFKNLSVRDLDKWVVAYLYNGIIQEQLNVIYAQKYTDQHGQNLTNIILRKMQVVWI